MKPKPIFFFGVFVIACVSVGVIYQGSNDRSRDFSDDDPKAALDSHHVERTSPANVRQAQMQTLGSDISPPISATPTTTAEGSAWEVFSGDEVPVEYSHLDSSGVDRAYIHIQRNLLEGLRRNANFDIQIPQTGSHYNARAQDILYHSNGDKTIKAFLTGQDSELYRLTITQGSNGTFGTISTPDGVYMLEAGVEAGWIASKSDLVKQQNRRETDVLILDDDASDLPSS